MRGLRYLVGNNIEVGRLYWPNLDLSSSYLAPVYWDKSLIMLEIGLFSFYLAPVDWDTSLIMMENMYVGTIGT